MLGTSTTYLLLQGPGLYYSGMTVSEVAWKESNWALAGMLLCFVLFVGYLWYQIQTSSSEELGGQQDRRNSVIEEALRKGEVTLLGVMQSEFTRVELRQHLSESTPLVLERNPELNTRLKAVLKPFFAKYDANGDGHLTIAELANAFRCSPSPLSFFLTSFHHPTETWASTSPLSNSSRSSVTSIKTATGRWTSTSSCAVSFAISTATSRSSRAQSSRGWITFASHRLISKRLVVKRAVWRRRTTRCPRISRTCHQTSSKDDSR
jgi:hypothetical protein